MHKFKNKVDGSVFYAEPSTVLYRILSNHEDFERVEEIKEEKKTTKKVATKK